MIIGEVWSGAREVGRYLIYEMELTESIDEDLCGR
jgi:hypothetical protein